MSQKHLRTVALAITFLFGVSANAQSQKYQRKAPAAPAAPAAGAPAKPADGKKATPAKPGQPTKEDEKLDISDLEQKYWAPKDTDFGVVQNRTYTKAKRLSLSLLAGPIVNDPFNSGNNTSISLNYYFSERFGVEAMYIKADMEDSKAVDNFKGLSGGGVLPDFNRPLDYTGIGFNFVPFYAKMSFMGKKIIYFDMQFTPHIGISSYKQIADTGIDAKEDSAFSYGLDVTQYFFFEKWFAVRINLHNRWYDEDIIAYQSGASRGSDSTNITNWLLGVTFFF